MHIIITLFYIAVFITVCSGQRILKCSGNRNKLTFLENWLEGYNKNIAPAEVVDVRIKLWVIMVMELNVLHGYGVFSTRLDQVWNDTRLSYKCENESDTGYIWGKAQIDSIWNPDMAYLDIMSASIPTKQPYLSILNAEDGTVMKSELFIVKIPCHPNVHTFPFDNLKVRFRFSTEVDFEDYQRIQWTDVSPFELYPKSSRNPEWYITSIATIPAAHFMRGGKYPIEVLETQLHFARYTSFYIFQCYIPPFCVVVLGGYSFFMNPETMTGRIGFSTSAILALFFQYGTIVGQLPRVGYVKGIDIWLLGCLLFLMFALTQYCILAFVIHYLMKKLELKTLKRIDGQTTFMGTVAEIKPKISTGVLPALFVEGKELNEGHPIARYLADVGGLVGKTQWERAQADSIVNQVKAYMDDNKEFNAWLHDNAMGKVAESKAVFQKYKEIVVPKLGKLLTTLLEKNNSTSWLVTWADLYAGELMDRIISTDPTAMNSFPKACELHKKIHSLPNIQAYCKERPPFTW